MRFGSAWETTACTSSRFRRSAMASVSSQKSKLKQSQPVGVEPHMFGAPERGSSSRAVSVRAGFGRAALARRSIRREGRRARARAGVDERAGRVVSAPPDHDSPQVPGARVARAVVARAVVMRRVQSTRRRSARRATFLPSAAMRMRFARRFATAACARSASPKRVERVLRQAEALPVLTDKLGE